VPFRVSLDGEDPGRSRGADVDEAGAGVLEAGRLYQLVRQPDESFAVADPTLWHYAGRPDLARGRAFMEHE